MCISFNDDGNLQQGKRVTFGIFYLLLATKYRRVSWVAITPHLKNHDSPFIQVRVCNCILATFLTWVKLESRCFSIKFAIHVSHICKFILSNLPPTCSKSDSSCPRYQYSGTHLVNKTQAKTPIRRYLAATENSPLSLHRFPNLLSCSGLPSWGPFHKRFHAGIFSNLGVKTPAWKRHFFWRENAGVKTPTF